MVRTKSDREKARMLTIKAVREKYRSGDDTWTGPTRITCEIRTSRVLKDRWQVGGGSLKALQDGLCFAALPYLDGPYIVGTKIPSPYIWSEPIQVRVRSHAEEGVLFTVQEISHA